MRATGSWTSLNVCVVSLSLFFTDFLPRLTCRLSCGPGEVRALKPSRVDRIVCHPSVLFPPANVPGPGLVLMVVIEHTFFFF